MIIYIKNSHTQSAHKKAIREFSKQMVILKTDGSSFKAQAALLTNFMISGDAAEPKRGDGFIYGNTVGRISKVIKHEYNGEIQAYEVVAVFTNLGDDDDSND